MVIQSIFSCELSCTDWAGVNEGIWEMNSFNVISYTSSCFVRKLVADATCGNIFIISNHVEIQFRGSLWGRYCILVSRSYEEKKIKDEHNLKRVQKMKRVKSRYIYIHFFLYVNIDHVSYGFSVCEHQVPFEFQESSRIGYIDN